MAPVLEVAHVLWRTLIARPVPTVPPVTASDEQTISTTACLPFSTPFAGMIEECTPQQIEPRDVSPRSTQVKRTRKANELVMFAKRFACRVFDLQESCIL